MDNFRRATLIYMRLKKTRTEMMDNTKITLCNHPQEEAHTMFCKFMKKQAKHKSD